LSISRTEAASFIETYFKTYSGVRAYLDNVILQTERDGYFSTLFGRRRYIPAIASRNKTEKSAAERVAVNTPIQGSAADIVKKAMLDLRSALQNSGDNVIIEKTKILLQVHDELILECPAEIAEKVSKIVKFAMENAVTLDIPLRVSIETGRRWGDFH
jgi:DNA polymerase-1